MIDQAILNAAIDFCERTKYWVYRSNDVTLVKGKSDYTLNIPNESYIVEIKDGVTHNAESVTQADESIVSDTYGADWYDEIDTDVKFIIVEQPAKIVTVPKPAASQTKALKNIKLVLRPSIDAIELPDFLYAEFARAIADGAVMELLDRPATEITPWGDMNLADTYRMKFEREVNRIKDKVANGYRNGVKQLRTRRHSIA